MELTFEWDQEKAAQNLKKHGVSFEEAKTVFGDRLSSGREDPAHSTDGEQWFLIIGQSNKRRTFKSVLISPGLSQDHTEWL